MMDKLNLFAVLTALQTIHLFTSGNGEQLFFSSPGNGSLAAGLYGGHLSDEGRGTQDHVLRYGYHCAERRGQLQTGLTLEAIAYDPISSQVLLKLLEDDDRTLSLYKGHLCHTSKCSNDSTEPTSLFNAVQLSHQIGPFVYHDNKIYFIFHKEVRLRPGKRRAITELRVFVGCSHRYPIQSSTPFDMERCTRLLATLAEEDYRRYPTIHVTSGFALSRIGGRKVFLVQFQHDHYSSSTGKLTHTSFVLYSIDDRGHKRELHRENVPTRYSMYILTQLGAVAYADHRVCWSALDRILCARFDGELSGVSTVLQPGQANGACNAPGEPVLANIVTGVAFQESHDGQLTVYFGCVADTARFGGAGVVRQKSGSTRMEVYPLTVNNHELYAGSMFITEDCRHSQPYSYTSTASFLTAQIVTVIAGLLLTTTQINTHETST